MPAYRMRRIYAAPSPDDGFRVLVDRLWPRGVTREAAALDLWAKAASPSDELRRWFHADREHRAAAFEERYRAELDASGAAAQLADELTAHASVTLLTANPDPEHSHVPVLLDALAHAQHPR